MSALIKNYKWLLFLVGIFILHSWWSYSGRNTIKKHSPLNIREVSEVGSEEFNTNIVCIQPYMQLQDYANLEVFYNKIDNYFSAIQKEGLLYENTIVVFPEHIGTPLVFVDEKESTIEAKTIDTAILLASASNFWNVGIEKLRAPKSNFANIFFKSKSEKMGEVFNFVFSSMAKKYQTYVIPGTIMLGSPIVQEGKLLSNGEEFQNISVLYQPEGTALPMVIHESNLSLVEKKLAKSSKNEKSITFTTPAGKTAIVLGDDIWRNTQFEKANHDVDIIINPLHSPVTLQNDSKSYFKTLGITESIKSDLSVSEELSKTLGEKNHTTVSVFLRGEILDYPLFGKSHISYQEELITGFEVKGASIISLGIQ